MDHYASINMTFVTNLYKHKHDVLIMLKWLHVNRNKTTVTTLFAKPKPKNNLDRIGRLERNSKNTGFLLFWITQISKIDMHKKIYKIEKNTEEGAQFY